MFSKLEIAIEKSILTPVLNPHNAELDRVSEEIYFDMMNRYKKNCDIQKYEIFAIVRPGRHPLQRGL